MSLYDGIKDVLRTVQKADNIDLIRQLLDLEQQALDMQDEIVKLKEENKILKTKDDIARRIVRHKGTYITLSSDSITIFYCSHCWDNEQKMIQMKQYNQISLFCPHCHSKSCIDDVSD